MNQLQKPEQLFWVDATKAICMIIVYFAHAEIYVNYTIMPINNLFRPFYVNAFFFVSGYLLFRKQMRPTIINQNRREWISQVGGGRKLFENIFFKLAIPTTLFAAINFFPKTIIRGECFELKGFLFDTVGGCSLWFTCCLVVVELLLAVFMLTRLKNIIFYLILSVFCAVLGVFLIKENIVLLDNEYFPWFYKNGLLATFYVTMGGLYWKFERVIDKSLTWYTFLFFLAIYLFVEYSMPDKALCLTSLGQMNVLGAFVSVVGSVLLIHVCKKLPENRLLTFIAKRSIVFYFFSGAVPIVMSVFLGRWVCINNVFGVLTVFVISLCLVIAISFVISKYLPFLLDLRMLKKTK